MWAMQIKHEINRDVLSINYIYEIYKMYKKVFLQRRNDTFRYIRASTVYHMKWCSKKTNWKTPDAKKRREKKPSKQFW